MTATTLPKSLVASSKPASESRIDSDSHFNGLYETKQDLRIEGVAEGEIQCEGTVAVAEGARVKAKITANAVTIAGELEGEVVCRGVFQILPSGQVQASVSAHRLIVQEGGLYNGEFHMIAEEDVAPVRTPGRKKSTASAAASEPSDGSPALGSDDWWARMIGETPGADGADAKPA